SSRRRHTRFSRDWSSDVCSSDLLAHVLIADDLDSARRARAALDALGDTSATIVTTGGDVVTAQTLRAGAGGERSRLELAAERDEIGRASCRERAWVSVGARWWRK